MADDKKLEVEIHLEATGLEAAIKSRDELVELKRQAEAMGVSTGDLDEQIKNADSNIAKLAKKTLPDAGEAAGNTRGKYMALHHVMSQLNTISPGLGEAVRLVADALRETGAAGEEGAAGAVTFSAALGAVLDALGPLVIAMLGIEATFKFWDLYREKVKLAAEAQEEATKRIVEAAHQARTAVEELDKALHPDKKNLANQDEADLKKQLDDLDTQYQHQKDLNKANEETANATTTITVNGVSTTAPDATKQAEIDKQIKAQQDAAGAAKKAYEEITRQISKLTGQTGDLGEKRADMAGQQQTDAGNAASKAQTDRQVQNIQTATSAEKVDEATAAALAAGQKVSPDAMARLARDATDIAGHAVTLKDAITIFQTAAKNQEAFVAQVGRLTDIFSRLSPQGLDDLEHKVDLLEAQSKANSSFNFR